MEDKFQLRAPLGSKLPKFGTSKPAGSFLQQAQNGTYNGISAKGNLVGEKHNEHDRTPAYSFSRSKLKYHQNDQISRTSPSIGIQKTSPFQTMVQNDGQMLGGTKVGKQSNMLVSHKEDLNENVYSSNKFTKGTQFGRTPYSSLNDHKPPTNGFYITKPPTGLYRPRANSATSRNFTNHALSSDNKPFSLVRRSQSFSHSVQNPQFPSASLTRSYSLHRDKDMTKVNQLQLLSARTDLRPRFPKQYGLSNGNESHIKSVFTRPYSTGLTAGLKKPASTNGPAASAPLGYKMTRPSLQKTSRSQEICDVTKDSPITPVNSNLESLSNGTCRKTEKHNKLEDEDLGFENYSSRENLERQDFKDSYFSEDVDELSISSLSSSDKNDFSEDFSDDFLDLEEKTDKPFPKTPSQYSLGEPQEEKQNGKKCDEWIDITDLKDGNKTLVVVQPEKSPAEEQSVNSSGELQLKKPCGSSNSDDWIDLNVSVQNEADPKSHPYGESAISPDMDYREPSSLELSPSDSSDGTYMWDEEGMEPIGNVHPCESYESSEMNSLDILNNIETCDLEEDDLMLDVEIPEDPPCDLSEGENMSRFDRSERNLRQQQLFWKRNPPRLNGQEQYHLSNPEHYHNGRGSSCLESPSDKKDNYGSPYCSPLSPCSPQTIGLHENTVMLDEMTLRHMVQDCTNVKTQLLKIKRLLQQGDNPESPVTDLQLSFPTTPEKVDAEIPLKTEDLLYEIAQLKEESKRKDEMIKQLHEKLKTRCKCQKEEPKTEKPKQHDKFSQTTCRRSSPHILQCSSSTPSSTDHHPGKLVAHQPIEVQNESLEHIQQCTSCNQNEDSSASSTIPENELSDLLSIRLKINDGEDNPDDDKKEHNKNRAVFDENKNVRPPEPSTNIVLSNADGPEKEGTSKKITAPSTSLPGQIPSPKTLQQPKSKLQNTLTNHRGSLVSPNSRSILTESKISARSPLEQDIFRTKNKPQTIQEASSVHQASTCVKPDSVSSRLDKISSPIFQSPKIIIDTKPVTNNSSPTHKLSTVGNSQTTAAEPSKPVSKLTPKGSLLKPPSYLTSKLRAPNISKSDIPTQEVLKEPQKPPTKATSSVIPRPPSQKKDGVREADASAIPKRQSRLPQPKT